MTDENSLLGSDSRRSFIKKGVLSTGALALGLGGSGAAAGQTDGGEGGGKAVMYNDEARPGAQFRVISPVIEQNPEIDGAEGGDLWSEYNTRRIEYLNTKEQAYFFPANDAEVQEGQVYELEQNFTLFDGFGNNEGLVTVSFASVPEDEILFPGDDNQLDEGEDFELLDGGGKALVSGQHYRPGALLQITSDVVSWTPRQTIEGSNIFSDYNTRHAEYLNTNDEFPIYPAQEADIQQGATYLVETEFTLLDPEENLYTIRLSEVNEDDLDSAVLGESDGETGTATPTGTDTPSN